ncbi:BhlA/UviB family holin-like peptide [Robertmurraya sp. Marseille-Q9965]
MDIAAIPLDVWLSQGVFAVLFVWLLIDTRKDSKEREQRLSTQIDKQNEAQEKIVLSLQALEQQISSLKEDK